MSTETIDEILARVERLDREATEGPWTRGETLNTPQTRRWTPAEIAANDRQERRRVFARFSPFDGGRSRQLIATADESLDACQPDAALIAAYRSDAPALAAEVRRLRLLLAERAAAEARAKRLADLLAEAGSALLDNAAVLHRHVLTTGSEKSDWAANRARAVAAKIDTALKDTP